MVEHQVHIAEVIQEEAVAVLVEQVEMLLDQLLQVMVESALLHL